MSDIKLVRTHSMPIAKARALAEKAAAALAAEYDLSHEWHGNSLHFHRSGVDGRMHVTASEIQLDVKLGLLLRAFKGKLLHYIERELDQLLPAKQAETPAKKTTKKTPRR